MGELGYEGERRLAMLVINPNSTEEMTDGLKPIAKKTDAWQKWNITFFTAPSGPKSINNEDDAAESLKHCAPVLTEEYLSHFDTFLVACYSAHPLVPWLQGQKCIERGDHAVTGILEASILKSLAVSRTDEKFGIISTGKVWEKSLTEATMDYLEKSGRGREKNKFAGVETTGLNATELHTAPAAEVEKRMIVATKRLLVGRKARTICLGCAGMAGMDDLVRRACKEELGVSNDVRIVDGVEAGINALYDAYYS